MDKLQKAIEYIKLNYNLKELKAETVSNLADYYNLSNEGRWFLLCKFKLNK